MVRRSVGVMVSIYNERHPWHHMVLDEAVDVGGIDFWRWELDDLISQIALRVAPRL
jgi:hypothetical protein